MTIAEVNDTVTNVPIINNTIENEKNSTTVKTEEPMNEDDEITLEDLAPDGGWGWMIALATILIFFTEIGPVSSFAIIFGDFLESSGQAGFASGLFNSVFMITFSIASLLSNMLLKRFSSRQIGIVAAFLFAIPNIFLAFVNSIYQMAFLYLIQGFGMGLVITITNTVFNSYFVKKRAKVMYAMQVIIALGGIVYPPLTERLMTLYGFRGTAAIVGALSLNSVAGMTMMHPVEWHRRKPEEIRAERARQRRLKSQELALSNRHSSIDNTYVSSKIRWSSLRSFKEESGTEIPLLIETLKTPAKRVASISAIEGEIHGKMRSGSIRESLARRLSALSSSSLINLASHGRTLGDTRHLENKSKEKQTDEEIQEKKEKANGNCVGEQEESEWKTILRDILDMSLLKNYCFINLCLGVSFVCTADYAFSSLLPLMMTDVGYTKADAALTVTISGIAELVAKVFLAIFTMIMNVKAKYVFFGATICMEFARTGFLLYERSLVGALSMTAVIGFTRSWLLVPQPLVIIEDLKIEKFASAYGIFSVICGLVTVVFGAIVGLIKDWTDSFDMYQISLLVLNGTFIIPWALQFIFVDFKEWRMKRAKDSATKSLFTNHR